MQLLYVILWSYVTGKMNGESNFSEIDQNVKKYSICAWSSWSINAVCEWPMHNLCAMSHTRQCYHKPPKCVCNRMDTLKLVLPIDTCYFMCPKKSEWSLWESWSISETRTSCIRVRQCYVGGKRSISTASCFPPSAAMENRSIIDEYGNEVKCEPNFWDNYGKYIAIASLIILLIVVYYGYEHWKKLYKNKPTPNQQASVQGLTLTAQRSLSSLSINNQSSRNIVAEVDASFIPHTDRDHESNNYTPPPSYDEVMNYENNCDNDKTAGD